RERRGGEDAHVEGLLRLLLLPPARRREAAGAARGLGPRPVPGARPAEPGVDRALDHGSAEAHAGHEDAVILPRRPARRAGRERRGADPRASRLHHVARAAGRVRAITTAGGGCSDRRAWRQPVTRTKEVMM